MKEEWKLRNKDSKTAFCYHEGTFHLMEKYCKGKIKDGLNDKFQIEYYQGGKLMDTMELTDCFNVDKYSATQQ